MKFVLKLISDTSKSWHERNVCWMKESGGREQMKWTDDGSIQDRKNTLRNRTGLCFKGKAKELSSLTQVALSNQHADRDNSGKSIPVSYWSMLND